MKLKFAAIPLTVIIGMFGLCLIGRADDIRVQKALDNQYKQMAQAYKNKNLSRFMKPLADDFVTVGLDGSSQTRSDYEASEKSGLADVQSVNEAVYKIDKIIAAKSEAVVICLSKIDSTILDKDGTLGKKGKTYRFVAIGISYDRWHNSKGIWELEYEEALTGKMTMNGKPFSPITTDQYFFNGKSVHSDFTPIK